MANSLSPRASILTHAGRGRPVNEDWCDVLEPRSAVEVQRDGWLWVVADGVGAYGTGREASHSAVEAILKAYRGRPEADPTSRLRQAIEDGNRACWERRMQARRTHDRPIMTTVLAALLVGERIVLANVGDCRGYLIRNGQIEQLTRDHKVVAEMLAGGLITPEQAEKHPERNVLSRALGQAETVEVDVEAHPIRPGDRVVLCSDGLTRYLEDAEILEVGGLGLPDVATTTMVERAKARGGKDDITVAVIEIVAAFSAPTPTVTRRPLPPHVAASRDHLATLHAIGQRISASLDLSETLESVITSIVEVTGAERGFVMLWDDSTSKPTYSLGRSLWSSERNVPEFSRNLVQTVFESGRPIRVGDASAEASFSRYESVILQGLRSVLCAPLQVQEKRVGVVYVEHRSRAEVFTEADLDLLCAFADQAAIALENARLHAQLQSQLVTNAVMRANQENVLRSINSAIISIDTTGHVLTFNRSAEKIFGVRAEDALRRELGELVPDNVREALGLAAQDQRGEHETAPRALQTEVHLPDRGRAMLSVKMLPLADEQGQPVGSVLVIDDITQQILLGVLGRFLPPSVLERIRIDPQSVELGGTWSNVTVLFADIRGFTALAEQHPPEQVLAILNSYLACATEVILSYGGTVDKFLGDGVMAFFNAPLPQADHVLAAVRAAMQMQARLHELRELEDEGIAFGIGINTGESIVGNIGTAQLMNYTVIGDVVNVAARLQDEARAGEVLISGRAHDEVAGAIETESLGLIHVKGRAQPVRMHKVLRVIG